MATKPKTTKSTTALPKSVKAFAPQVETLLTTGRTVFEEQCKAGYDLTTGNIDKVTKTMMNNFNGTSGMNTEMMEAATQYYQTWTKGCEEIAKSYASCCQSMYQDWTSSFKTLTTAKTVQDAVSVQSEFVRQQFDKVMSESTKISELCVKVASEAAEPIQSQWSTMATKYSKAA